VPVTRDAVVGTGCAFDADLSFPVAVKVLSPDIAHKTDIGGVELNIGDRAEMGAAIGRVIGNARAAMPDARIDGAIVSEMIDDGTEALIGVVNDPVFGPAVALGLGGVFAEVLRDVTYRIAPFGEDVAREMIAELRGRALFEGARGALPGDTDALAAVLAAVSRLAWSQRAGLESLDINPLFVRPRGRGVVAADALVALRNRRGTRS